VGVSTGREWPLKLKERCEDVGWQVVYSNSGHYKVLDQRAKLLFTFASTPTGRGYVEKNAIAEANRHGLAKLEAATARVRENNRLLKIAADRAANQARIDEINATMIANGGGDGSRTEPDEPAASETDAQQHQQPRRMALVDPGAHDARPDRPYVSLFCAPSRTLIDGSRVIAAQPAVMPFGNAHGPYTTSTVLETLLEDGRTVFMCNSPNAPECTTWGFNPGSIRAHLKIHSTRMIAVRAARAAEAARRELEEQLKRERETRINFTVTPPTQQHPAATGTPLSAHLAAVYGILDQLADAFATLIVTTANVQRQFDALRGELKKIADSPTVSDEMLAKIAKYEALSETLRTLMQ